MTYLQSFVCHREIFLAKRSPLRQGITFEQGPHLASLCYQLQGDISLGLRPPFTRGLLARKEKYYGFWR